MSSSACSNDANRRRYRYCPGQPAPEFCAEFRRPAPRLPSSPCRWRFSNKAWPFCTSWPSSTNQALIAPLSMVSPNLGMTISVAIYSLSLKECKAQPCKIIGEKSWSMQRGAIERLSFHLLTGYIDLRRTANALFFPPSNARRADTLTAITRDFTATTFVVHEGATLLLWHKKMQAWLPPGGHIDRANCPKKPPSAKCGEETGLTVELLVPTRAMGTGRRPVPTRVYPPRGHRTGPSAHRSYLL